MSISLQTNVNSLVAQQNLSVTNKFQSQTIAQLTSGYRINSSGDDAAGLAVANKFRSSIAELTQGVANGNDAVAQLQIMDGGMNNISQILDRLKTLATQSASGTFTGNRATLNGEFQTDLAEIDRQATSIGLNTGGTFAKSLNVYLGAGSGSGTGSAAVSNATVTSDLTQSAVDSQSLGMKGMQAVNTVYAPDGTNSGTDIGSTSGSSVQSIIGNNSNHEATAGYAALQFSGTGFSDAGKVGISVNLSGVTDTATLVTAVNGAIQSAGNGTTAAATAFKNANIIATVHTDSSGGQQLAFSSSTSAFQVQAGDQMANALLGNVTAPGSSLGTDVSGTSVAGATTTDGLLAQGQTVKLVVTGGGLASPATLQVNTAGLSQVSTSGAITDLETQFSSSAQLTAAGLTMTGSSTPGSQLHFASATGQTFNIQVTGDSANLLGLGSFLADSTKSADYTSITAGAAYSAAALTGSATTVGLTDGLEVSLNGQQATALTPIDMTTGAHAVAASLTSSAGINGVAPGNLAGTVDITAANQDLDITVINNGAVTNHAIALSTNTVATQGAAISSVVQSTYSSKTVSAALLNNQFTVAIDGGTAKTLTLADGTYATAASFLAAVTSAIASAPGGSMAGLVTASYATVGGVPGVGALTLTSAHTAGVDSSVSIGAATTASLGAQVSTLTSAHDFAGTPIVVSAAAHNNQFSVAVDGGAAVTLTVADGSYATSGTFLTAIQTAVSGHGLTAAWDANNGNKLTLTSSGTPGAGSSVLVGQVTNTTSGAQVSTLTSAHDFAGTPLVVSAAAHNNEFSVTVDGGAAVKLTVADGSYATSGAFLTAVQTAVSGHGLTAAWDANNGNKLTLTSSGTPGAGSSVLIGQATDATFGAAVSTLTSAHDFAGTPVAVSAAAHNNQFTIADDGGAAVTLTVADGSYATSGTFLTAIQNAVSGHGLTAAWDPNNGNKLTLTRNAGTAGAGSTVAIGQATYTTAAANLSTLTDDGSGNIVGGPIVITGGANDQFTLAVDGGPSVTLTLAAASYATSASLMGEINTEIAAGGVNIAGKVSASWASSGVLTLTSTSTNGAASFVNVSASASNDAMATLGYGTGSTAAGTTATNTGMGNVGLSTGLNSGNAALANTGWSNIGLTKDVVNSGNAALANTGWSNIGLTKDVIGSGNAAAANSGMAVTMGLSAGLNSGVADGPASVASIAAQIQSAFGGTALVTVSNDYKISIASTTKGANSSVLLNATANSAYGTLNLTSPVAVVGQNSSIGDIVDNLNAQFAANGTAYQAAGLKAVATGSDGTGTGPFITILSNNNTQFRLNAVGAPAVATAAALSSTVTDASFSAATPITVTLNTNDKFNVAVNGLVAQTLQVAAGSYTTSGAFLTAVNNAIALSTDPTNGLNGRVTAGWDAATRQLTLTSVATGTTASVTTSAVGGNTGLANFGFGAGGTNSGQLFSHTENTGFGVAGSSFTGASPSSSATAMSTLDAYGISNTGVLAFQAMQYGNDKQALTFSATDSTGRLETNTITLQNNASTNRAGVSIDDAVAYINRQLQQSTSNPALQQIVAVKEKVGAVEKINFVSSLSSFTIGVAATASGKGVNAGAPTQAIQVTSKTNGTGATMSIDTQAGAEAAVAAISAAVAKLGSAQAAVGIGQNQLGYAINLANSQITNFSSAESQIRDANVAMQAANLSKAQVLSQASIAAMAQANSATQGVLALLRG